MRALPLLRALALPTAVLLMSGACSLMAPSDAELVGDAAQPSSSKSGSSGSSAAPGGASTGGVDSEPGPLPAGGEESLGAGGAAGGASDFSSLIPREGLELWLMADHGIGEVEGDRVAIWADFSPNEGAAKQLSAALQPKLRPAADGSPPLVELDGTDDQLALPDGFSDFSAGLSAFVIAKAATDTSCQALLHLSNGGEAEGIQLGRYKGSVHYEVGGPSVTGPDNAFTLAQRMLVGVVHAPGKVPEVRLNGVFMASGNFTDLPVNKVRTTNFVGRSLYRDCQPFQGQIGEIILYSRALDASEREAVQSYLQSKWSYEPPVKTKPVPGEIPAAK